MNLSEKKTALENRIRSLKSVLVAFSGGTDSTFLLKMSHLILKENVVAVTAVSALQPSHEKEGAIAQAKAMGVKHIIIPGRALENPEFLKNDKNRCYYCKRLLFDDLLSMARELGLDHVAHGANSDDLKDYRPGFRAADELGIVAPLLDVGMGKDDIRALSKEMDLSTWDKPAMACLVSRIPYGVSLTHERLNKIDAAEEILRKEGFRSSRVRHHGNVARIEVPDADIEQLMDADLRYRIVTQMRDVGFTHISLDLAGYSQGSMNEGVNH